jgi:hypothetical protein
MFELQTDFEEYLAQLKRARQRTLIYLFIALGMTVTFSVMCVLLANQLHVPGFGQLEIDLPDIGFLSQFINPSPYSSWNNALGTALFGIQIAITSVIRYWYLRQDKLITLLTQALVIEQETEYALRLMLNNRIR